MTWAFYAILSAVFAALVAIFGKIGLKGIDTTMATTLRSLVMAFFLVTVSLSFHKFSFVKDLNPKALFFILFSGIVGALSWLFYFLALQNGPASGVAALDRLSVIFVVILAALLFGESLTLKSIIGVLFLVMGAVLLVLK